MSYRRRNYLLYFLADLLLCGVFSYLYYLKGVIFNLWILSLCFVFGVIFMPLVIRRLPIFRSFYIIQKPNVVYQHAKTDYANQRVAPVMCSMVTGLVLALFFYIINYLDDFSVYCMIGAIASGAISFYYAP